VRGAAIERWSPFLLSASCCHFADCFVYMQSRPIGSALRNSISSCTPLWRCLPEELRTDRGAPSPCEDLHDAPYGVSRRCNRRMKPHDRQEEEGAFLVMSTSARVLLDEVPSGDRVAPRFVPGSAAPVALWGHRWRTARFPLSRACQGDAVEPALDGTRRRVPGRE
jgi:hypothetical protein